MSECSHDRSDSDIDQSGSHRVDVVVAKESSWRKLKRNDASLGGVYSSTVSVGGRSRKEPRS